MQGDRKDEGEIRQARYGRRTPSPLRRTLVAMAAAGRHIVCQPDDLCAALWARARASGYVAGDLYVVSSPVPTTWFADTSSYAQPNQAAAAMEGAYYRDSDDVWVLSNPAEPWRAPQTLIHEIAHAVRRPLCPTTIDQDWDEEVATWLTAPALLHAMEIPELLTTRALRDIIAETETLRRHHHAAARLVGTTCPRTARAAYGILRGLGVTLAWSQEHFEAVLDGDGTDDDQDAVLDLDRSALRAHWLSARSSIDFGPFARPSDASVARTLHSGLVFSASEKTPALDAFVSHVGLFGRFRRADVTVACEVGLGVALNRAMGAFLAHPECTVRAAWTLFADTDTPVRWYRLQAFYEPLTAVQTAPTRTELWIKVGDGLYDAPILDGALQRFIASWGQVATLETAPIALSFDAHWAM